MATLSLIRRPIESELADYKKVFDATLQHPDGLLGSALTHIRNRQGKMMRPILVLLTAKATRQEQIDGMRESGADLYVTKPFDIEFLQMCIHNILNNRSSSVVNRADPAPSGTEEEEPVSAQEKFIARFQQVLEQELSNPDLSIDSLSRALYVSRVHLHRRIKSIYGMSPSDYIREQRLKRAEKLLVANKLSVSEIAYAVGFNTAGSFAVAFKKFYGMTPSKYGEIHQKTDKK